jgi:hypothetical protein
VTTDGVTANWHCVKVDTSQPKGKGNKKKNQVHVDKLSPKHFGTFPKEVMFGLRPKNIIAVDPGHANLIAAVRVHEHMVLTPSEQSLTKSQKRKQNLQKQLEARNRSLFNLSNKEWSANCGRLTNRRSSPKSWAFS